MRGRKFRSRTHLGKRYGVSAWIPPQSQKKAAHERTEGIVGYFISACRREWPQYVDDLHTLARSCYLQGARDTAHIAAKMILAKRSEASNEGHVSGPAD